MFKYSCLTFSLTLLAALSNASPIPGEFESPETISPHFNGMRVKAPNNPSIYLVDRGCRRHIPNPSTFNNLFRDWNYYTGLDIYNIDECSPISNGAHLAKCPSRPHVYLVDRGHKRHVTSPSVMDKYNFAWSKIQNVSCNVLDAIPTADSIY